MRLHVRETEQEADYTSEDFIPHESSDIIYVTDIAYCCS